MISLAVRAAIGVVFVVGAWGAAAQTATDGTTPALRVIDAAIDSGRLETARDVISRTAAVQDTPELRLRAAELALANGALPAAVTSFAALTGDAGVGARAQQGLGLTQYRLGEMAAAKAALELAVAADAGLVRSWIALGVIADRARDFAGADAAYARALTIDGASAAALTNRGYSLLLRGQAAAAEADLVRAASIDPQSKVAATNLRMARAMQGRYREAFTGSTKATLAADLNTVGFGAMARGDMHTAETYFNRALALDTHFDPVAWANLRYLKSLTQPLGTGVKDEAADN